MAMFRQHVTFSSCLGAGYAAALVGVGVETVHAVLSGAVCGVAGMLPDLDSDSGRPVRELFSLLAAAVPLLLLSRMQEAGWNAEEMILAAGTLYLAIRYGLAWVFKHLTVHRGMFHSLPAAVIAAEIAFLTHTTPDFLARLVLAGGVFLGFLSHLVLDELYRVDTRNLHIRLNPAAGSALKFASRSIPATLCTWLVLAALTYSAGVEEGFFSPIWLSAATPHAAVTPSPGEERHIVVDARPTPSPQRGMDVPGIP